MSEVHVEQVSVPISMSSFWVQHSSLHVYQAAETGCLLIEDQGWKDHGLFRWHDSVESVRCGSKAKCLSLIVILENVGFLVNYRSHTWCKPRNYQPWVLNRKLIRT